MAAPLPVDVERIRADHAAYVKGWADARADARENISRSVAILAACRVADAVPALLDELVALRDVVEKAKAWRTAVAALHDPHRSQAAIDALAGAVDALNSEAVPHA